MSTRTYKDMSVLREGKQIVLPEQMSYAHAREWLTRIEQSEEQIINMRRVFPCFPLDGALAVSDAAYEMFGATELPTRQLQIPCDAHGGTVPCYWGNIVPPPWEGGYVAPTGVSLHELTLVAQVKRKYEHHVNAFFDAVALRLATKSLYKGQAIRVRFPEDDDWGADMLNTAPVFLDLNGITERDLILNADVHFALQSNVFTLVERTDLCRKARIPLRHGMLLAGPYGTGKTLSAKVIAAKCVANGWTFIYLEDVRQIAHGLRVAEMFMPAVLFAEDIDTVVSEARNKSVNDVLNVLDGIDTKNKPVITVLTTNRLEAIHRSLLRAGRIDTIVEYELPDAQSAWRFVQLYCTDANRAPLVVPGIDQQAVGSAFAGLLPAFISESVQKAKRYGLLTGELSLNGTGKLTPTPGVSQDTLIRAAGAIRRHSNLVAEPVTYTHERQLVNAAALLGNALHAEAPFTTNGH